VSSAKIPVLAALLANLGVAVAKFVAFVFTGSTAMLAETVHSLADSGNEVLLLRGENRARQPATRDHPFGFGRFRYFNAFLVAVGIFTVGGLFALYEGAHRVVDRAPVEQPGWAVGVLVAAMVMEGASLRTAVAGVQQVREGRGWWEFVRTTKTPDLAVPLLEDSGALIGLVIALAGVIASVLTGNGAWDGVASLLIGVVLIGLAVLLGIETRSLLLGEAASQRRTAKIRDAALGGPGVRAIVDLRTMHLSPDQLLVVATLELDGSGSAADVVGALDGCERAIRDAAGLDCLIYLRPALAPVVRGEPAPRG
jgi:cation diffusion facilitator family transporter